MKAWDQEPLTLDSKGLIALLAAEFRRLFLRGKVMYKRKIPLAATLLFLLSQMTASAQARWVKIVWDHDQQHTGCYIIQASNQPDVSRRDKWITIKWLPADRVPKNDRPLVVELPAKMKYIVVFAVSDQNPSTWSAASNVLHVPESKLFGKP